MSDTFQLTIELQQTVKDFLPDTEQEFKRFLAVKLYLNESVSIGTAAEIAGMRRVNFETYLGEREIPISLLDYDDIQAERDIMKAITAPALNK
jgi:predicted HTH domain antitoxin